MEHWMQLDAAGLSSPGEREQNEDSLRIVMDTAAFFAAADGLGGHDGGSSASAIAVAQAEAAFCGAQGDIPQGIEQAFACAHNEILRSGTGLTTLALLVITPRLQARWAHAGDTRVYYFPARHYKRYVRTLDHSVPQALASQGMIQERDIRFHEDRNRLLRALGDPSGPPRYELSEEHSAGRGSAFLLCTDGFWEWLPERTMIRLLRRARSAQDWLLAMEQALLQAGRHKGMDNYSAIAVRIK